MLRDELNCPHCGHCQDQSNVRPWHSLGHADEIEHNCDSCRQPMTITANLYFEAKGIDE